MKLITKQNVYCAVREGSTVTIPEYLDLDSISLDYDECKKKAEETDKLIPLWAKEHRIKRITIVIIQECL